MKKKIISVFAIRVVLFSSIIYNDNTVKAASYYIESASVKISQNINAVSTAKWNVGTPGNYTQNTCFDYLSSRAPYSNWSAIDYTNSAGKANYEDRVLRQAVIRVWKGTSFA